MDIIASSVLGLVQGITEFLPVSSTGHLILTRELLGVDDTASLAFDAVLHFATALAVIMYFFGDIYRLVQAGVRMLGRLPVDARDTTMIKALAIGTVPALVAGVLFESHMEGFFRSPILVAVVLIAGSFFFMYAEYVYDKRFHNGHVDVGTGFRIGLFQTLALLPGFSRSGATIAGGMILGLSRSDAARFSFLLAIPIIVGGGLKKLIELMMSDVAVSWTPILVGASVAFVVGLFAIHFMISFVRKYSLWPFIWYRIILACFVLFVTFSG